MCQPYIRAPYGSQSYWSKWIDFGDDYIREGWEILSRPSGNPAYEPQYALDQSLLHLRQILTCYSGGRDVCRLKIYFEGLLHAWEESERLGRIFWNNEEQYMRHSWDDNYHHYEYCLSVVSLALLLDMPNEQWQRLLLLVLNRGAHDSNAGKDGLIDRLIHVREPLHPVSINLLYPTAYQGLLDVLLAPPAEKSILLFKFLNEWYGGLKIKNIKNKPKRSAYDRKPYWYDYGDVNFQGGAYFGRWCLEAAAVAKAFGIDDSACLGHEHYPGDMLRPREVHTHPVRTLSDELLDMGPLGDPSGTSAKAHQAELMAKFNPDEDMPLQEGFRHPTAEEISERESPKFLAKLWWFVKDRRQSR